MALIAHTGKATTDHDSVTTDAIDTTGANLIVIAIGGFIAVNPLATPTDSKSNSYTPLTEAHDSSSDGIHLYYCYAPTVGSGHTFSTSGVSTYPVICVEAFSNANSSPFDQENSTPLTGAGTTLQPGSITPSQNNEIVVSAIAFGADSADATVDSGFTRTDYIGHVGGTSDGCGMAYKIQTTAAAVNPTWTFDSTSNGVAAIASFKAASSGPSVTDLTTVSDTTTPNLRSYVNVTG